MEVGVAGSERCEETGEEIISGRTAGWTRGERERDEALLRTSRQPQRACELRRGRAWIWSGQDQISDSDRTYLWIFGGFAVTVSQATRKVWKIDTVAVGQRCHQDVQLVGVENQPRGIESFLKV